MEMTRYEIIKKFAKDSGSCMQFADARAAWTKVFKDNMSAADAQKYLNGVLAKAKE